MWYLVLNLISKTVRCQHQLFPKAEIWLQYIIKHLQIKFDWLQEGVCLKELICPLFHSRIMFSLLHCRPVMRVQFMETFFWVDQVAGPVRDMFNI